MAADIKQGRQEVWSEANVIIDDFRVQVGMFTGTA